MLVGDLLDAGLSDLMYVFLNLHVISVFAGMSLDACRNLTVGMDVGVRSCVSMCAVWFLALRESLENCAPVGHRRQFMAWSGKSECVIMDWGVVGLLRRVCEWFMVGPVRYVRVSFFWNARAVYRPIRVCGWVVEGDEGGRIPEGLIMNLIDHGPVVSLYHISYLAVDSGSAWEIHHFVSVWLFWVYIASGVRSVCGLSSL